MAISFGKLNRIRDVKFHLKVKETMSLQFLSKTLLGACLAAVMLMAGCTSQEKSEESQSVDRTYVLDAKMIGYTGIGGGNRWSPEPNLKST